MEGAEELIGRVPPRPLLGVHDVEPDEADGLRGDADEVPVVRDVVVPVGEGRLDVGRDMEEGLALLCVLVVVVGVVGVGRRTEVNSNAGALNTPVSQPHTDRQQGRQTTRQSGSPTERDRQ